MSSKLLNILALFGSYQRINFNGNRKKVICYVVFLQYIFQLCTKQLSDRYFFDSILKKYTTLHFHLFVFFINLASEVFSEVSIK